MAEFDLNAFIDLADVQRTKEETEELLSHLMETTQLLEGCTRVDSLEHTIAATTARFFKPDGTSIIGRIEYHHFHDIEESNRITNQLYDAGIGVCQTLPHNPNDPTNKQSDVLRLGKNGEIRVTFSPYIPGDQASPSLYYNKDPKLGRENYRDELGPLVQKLHAVTPLPHAREFNPLVWAEFIHDHVGGIEAFDLSTKHAATLEQIWERAVDLRDRYFSQNHTSELDQSELAYVHGELNPRNCYWRATNPDDPENSGEELALLDFVTTGVTTKELAAHWDAVRILDGETHFGRHGTFNAYVHGYSRNSDGFHKDKIDRTKVMELAEISDAAVFTIQLCYGMLPGNEKARELAIDRLDRYKFGPEGREEPWNAHQTQQQQGRTLAPSVAPAAKDAATATADPNRSKPARLPL